MFQDLSHLPAAARTRGSHNDRSEYPLCSRTQSRSISLLISYTHIVESPPVKRVLLAFCLTSYSARCVRESVWRCERSRWRWVYNHGTVVVFIIILSLFLLLTKLREKSAEERRGGGELNAGKDE